MEKMGLKAENDDVKEGDIKKQRTGDIGQLLVEVMPENEKLSRVLALVQEWQEEGKILIFVNSDEQCDALSKHLIQHGCLSLHDNDDNRESTISDFKARASSNGVLIATNIAASEGLGLGEDIKDVKLMINFDLPIEYEDYYNLRVAGRTHLRKGERRTWCTLTFLSSHDNLYAPHLVDAMQDANQVVPDDLLTLADKCFIVLDPNAPSSFDFERHFLDSKELLAELRKKAQARNSAFAGVVW